MHNKVIFRHKINGVNANDTIVKQFSQLGVVILFSHSTSKLTTRLHDEEVKFEVDLAMTRD